MYDFYCLMRNKSSNYTISDGKLLIQVQNFELYGRPICFHQNMHFIDHLFTYQIIRALIQRLINFINILPLVTPIIYLLQEILVKPLYNSGKFFTATIFSTGLPSLLLGPLPQVYNFPDSLIKLKCTIQCSTVSFTTSTLYDSIFIYEVIY